MRSRRRNAGSSRSRPDGPTVLALTRQNLPTLRGAGDDNLCARGAYILAGEAADPIRLIASGSEVELALDARDLLAKDGLAAAVVSMPSWELFAEQSESYRDEVMGGDGTVRVACEAATGFGWERWLGAKGAFVGMTGFGASGKASDLYKHFGITAEAIAEAARRLAQVTEGETWLFGLQSTASVASAAMCCAPSWKSGRKDIEVVAINDLGPVETNAHLFRFDSVHGRFTAR